MSQPMLQTGNNAYKKLLIKLREQIIAGNILTEKTKKP
jgi:hypothetical protein